MSKTIGTQPRFGCPLKKRRPPSVQNLLAPTLPLVPHAATFEQPSGATPRRDRAGETFCECGAPLKPGNVWCPACVYGKNNSSANVKGFAPRLKDEMEVRDAI